MGDNRVMTQDPRKDEETSGVWFPPPLLFVAGLAMALGLERLVPLPPVPVRPARTLALIALAGWASLTISSFSLFIRARTSVLPTTPTRALVTSGPYRLSRNPLYVAILCLYTALSLWFDIGWALVLLPVVVGAVQRFVIVKEEAYLERRFGQAYREYKTRVRRWI
jgi:protein-S-isoprenylcysteine O-methyltransferase Ste14